MIANRTECAGPTAGRKTGRTGSSGFWLAQTFIVSLAILLLSQMLKGDRSEVLPEAKSGKSIQAAPHLRDSGSRPEAALFGRTPTNRTESPGAESDARTSKEPHRDGPYRPDQYRTRRVSDADDYELWDLDPDEVAWLFANQRQVLTRDLETAPEPTGGIRVRRIGEGSFGALRGLRVGDVLLQINGQDLDGAADVEDLLEAPEYSGAKGWRVQLLRDGRLLTLDYRRGG